MYLLSGIRDQVNSCTNGTPPANTYTHNYSWNTIYMYFYEDILCTCYVMYTQPYLHAVIIITRVKFLWVRTQPLYLFSTNFLANHDVEHERFYLWISWHFLQLLIQIIFRYLAMWPCSLFLIQPVLYWDCQRIHVSVGGHMGGSALWPCPSITQLLLTSHTQCFHLCKSNVQKATKNCITTCK